MTKGITRSEEEVQLGLRVLALCNGEAAQASRLLKSEGVDIPRNTLTGWKNGTHAHRYLEMLHEHQQEISSRTADTAMQLAGRAQQGSADLVEETIKRKEEIEPKDLARSALALTQVTAEQVRTGRLLREQPTSISEVREPNELIEELKALGIAHRNRAIDVEVFDEPVAS